MKKIISKLNLFALKAENKVRSFIYDENGDTNFISILVILGIALALAGVFLTFKDQIIEWVDTNIGDFFGREGGRKGTG